MHHTLSCTVAGDGRYEGVDCTHMFCDMSAGQIEHADGSYTCQASRRYCVCAIRSQRYSALEKALTPFLRALLGMRAPLEKAVLNPVPV